MLLRGTRHLESRWYRLPHRRFLAPGRNQDWYLHPLLRLLQARLDMNPLLLHVLRTFLRSLGLRSPTRLRQDLRVGGLRHMVQLDVPLAGKLRLTLRYPDHLTGTAYAELSTPSIWKWSSSTS